MLGSRYTGYVEVDGELLTNQLIQGFSSNSKKEVIKYLGTMVEAYLLPKWMNEHNLKYRITDRVTGETIVL